MSFWDWANATADKIDYAIDRFNEWWLEPGPNQYGPGIMDFEPDWGLQIPRAAFRRWLRARSHKG